MKSEEKKRTKWPIVVLLCVVAALIIAACIYMKYRTIIRDGGVYDGWVRIADEKYICTGFETEGRKKKIAEIDGWGVYEVKEDPSHTFLKLKDFTGEEYIVREDYEIPTEGKVNCVYVNGKRITDKIVRESFDEILATEYSEGKLYHLKRTYEDQNRWKHVELGYEDCPVGTDYSIYGIAKLDSRWAIMFREDIGEWEDGSCPAVYHELDPKYNEIFEVFENW